MSLVLLLFSCAKAAVSGWLSWPGLPSVPSGLAKQAWMVLLTADGMPNAQIA